MKSDPAEIEQRICDYLRFMLAKGIRVTSLAVPKNDYEALRSHYIAGARIVRASNPKPVLQGPDANPGSVLGYSIRNP